MLLYFRYELRTVWSHTVKMGFVTAGLNSESTIRGLFHVSEEDSMSMKYTVQDNLLVMNYTAANAAATVRVKQTVCNCH